MTSSTEKACTLFAQGLRLLAEAVDLLPAALKEHAAAPVDTSGWFTASPETSSSDQPSTVSEALFPDRRENPVPFELQSSGSVDTPSIEMETSATTISAEEAPLASFPEETPDFDYDTAVLTGCIADTFNGQIFSAASLASLATFNNLPFLDHDFSLPFAQKKAAIDAFLKEIAGRGQVIAQFLPGVLRRYVSIEQLSHTPGFETYRQRDNGIAR